MILTFLKRSITLTDEYISGTDGPRLGAWTSINQFTEAEEIGAPISKSTRHILTSDSRSIYFTPKIPSKLNRNGDLDYNDVNAAKAKGEIN